VKALRASLTSRHFTWYALAFSGEIDDLQYAAKLAESGKLRVHIDNVYPVEKTREAIGYLLNDHAQGKVVIRTDFHQDIIR
jgi:NADPH:quinone reductase-like Zn-dependent oxidoreductase